MPRWILDAGSMMAGADFSCQISEAAGWEESKVIERERVCVCVCRCVAFLWSWWGGWSLGFWHHSFSSHCNYFHSFEAFNVCAGLQTLASLYEEQRNKHHTQISEACSWWLCARMCVFMSQGVGGFSKCSHHPKYLLAGKTSRAFFTWQTCVQDTKTFLQFVVNSTFLTSKLSRTDLIGHILWLCSRTEWFLRNCSCCARSIQI